MSPVINTMAKAKYRLRDVHIKTGHISLGERLGRYYIDLSPALPLIESEYHGPLDNSGVPMNKCGSAGNLYVATTIAQYAIALHDKMLVDVSRAKEIEPKFAKQIEAIIRGVEPAGERAGLFLNCYVHEKYPELEGCWASGLTQGNAISALLRGYQFYKDERMLKVATQAFDALDLPIESGGVRVVDRCGHTWFEEYPTNPPLLVLNGFIFALWGVIDYARATGSAQAWEWWKEGVETLRAHIPEFDRGFWSLYDLRDKELASEYYQSNIHVPQLEALHLLTGDSIFKSYADRWRRFSVSPACRTACWLALRIDARIRNRRRARSDR